MQRICFFPFGPAPEAFEDRFANRISRRCSVCLNPYHHVLFRSSAHQVICNEGSRTPIRIHLRQVDRVTLFDGLVSFDGESHIVISNIQAAEVAGFFFFIFLTGQTSKIHIWSTPRHYGWLEPFPSDGSCHVSHLPCGIPIPSKDSIGGVETIN